MAGDAGQALVPRSKRSMARNSSLRFCGVPGRDLPALIDEHKARIESGAVLLIADADGKAAVAAGVTKDLTEDLNAVDIVRAAVAELGGKGGGGRPDMARAKDTSNAEGAIKAAEALL